MVVLNACGKYKHLHPIVIDMPKVAAEIVVTLGKILSELMTKYSVCKCNIRYMKIKSRLSTFS